MAVKNTDILDFLYEANRAIYKGKNDFESKKESDNSTTIEYKNAKFRIHDNFFGGEPFGGREVIFFNNKPIWMMVYFGYLINGEKKEIYEVLTEGFRNTTKEMPYRGPSELLYKGYRYENVVHGDVPRLSGEEKIYKDGELAFTTKYIGGLIDIS